MNKKEQFTDGVGSVLKGVTDKVMSVKPSSIGKTYQKHIGSRPVLESLLAGGALGYGAYKATPFISRKLMERFMAGASDQEIEHALQDAKREGRMADVGKTLGIAGAATGALYPFLKRTNFSGSAGDAVRSYLGGGFYSQNEPIAKYNRQAHRKGAMDRVRERHNPIPIPGIPKSASFQDPLVNSRIPVSYSLDLLNSDPFLREQDKVITSAILEGSEEGSGITSGKGIIRTAIRAGVGFVPAYAFGKVITGIADMPEPAAKRLSLAGGLAGAIYNTGIIQELGN
jgi:hypothetical protein